MSDVSPAFETFLETAVRREAPWLAPDAPPPPSWDGSAAAWESARSVAAVAFRATASVSFARRIAEGWSSRELVAGALDRGAQATAGGQVIRPTSAIPGELSARAQRALDELSRIGINLRMPGGSLGVTVSSLSSAAAGTWGGTAREVEAFIGEAQAVVAAHNAGQRTPLPA